MSTATWKSVDPRNNNVVAYAPADSAALEASFQNGDKEHVLFFGSAMFTVNFSSMRQVNTSGGSRKVIRDGPPVPLKVNAGETKLTDTVLKDIVAVCQDHDEAVAALKKNIHNRSYKMKWNGKKLNHNVITALTAAIDMFKAERYRNKYGFCSDADSEVLNLNPGDPVPAYFANVVNQSIYHRKMLSLAGIRNMAIHGLDIFEEMRMQRFSGNISDYKNKTGPHKMKYFSGTVVDLDTIVLNAKTQYNIVNAVLKKEGKKQFKSEKEFQESSMARTMIMDQAKMLIKEFADDMKLNSTEMDKRKLNLDVNVSPIPKATSNNERGTWPLWHYENVGVSTFHVNVPTMNDIFGALLLAPFHLAKAFALLQIRYKDASPEELTEAFDQFFEDGVSDSCFNGKWKAIELYLSTIDNIGSIDNVLYELQSKNQGIFTPDFFEQDPDRTKEAKVMWDLVEKAKMQGRDGDGVVRDIKPDDIVAWMKAQE